jgi:hypothetical protein
MHLGAILSGTTGAPCWAQPYSVGELGVAAAHGGVLDRASVCLHTRPVQYCGRKV